MKPDLSTGEFHPFEGGMSLALSPKRGPVGMAVERTSGPASFIPSLDNEGGGTPAPSSVEGSLGLYGGALPSRGPDGTLAGIDRSMEAVAGGLLSLGRSSFLVAPSMEIWLVLGVRLGRVEREAGSLRTQLASWCAGGLAAWLKLVVVAVLPALGPLGG